MKNKRLLTILAILIIFLSFISSLAGIFSNEVGLNTEFMSVQGETVQLYNKGIYARDSITVASQAIAQDIVTLIIGIPFLCICISVAQCTFYILHGQNSKKYKRILRNKI